MSTAQIHDTQPSTGSQSAEQRGGRRWLRRPTSAGGWLLAGVISLVVLVGLGNLAIILSHLTALALGPDDDLEIEGIPRARAVDEQLWRGRAPTDEGYASLAERGVEVVVDLRAEEFQRAPEDLLQDLGLELVRLPIRDGQTPTPAQVADLMTIIEESDSPVFVHCGAGVGRTGAVAAAYGALTSDRSNAGLLWENFSIGPPSLEQIVYAASVDSIGEPEQPAGWVKAISRAFDGPRRIWHNLRGDV